MINRRDFLKLAGLAAANPWGCAQLVAEPTEAVLNDTHSRLNPTEVEEILPVSSLESLQATVIRAGREGKSVSVAGGRHAMGAQQFGTGTLHLDTRPFKRVVNFDAGSGLLEVEPGIQWPELIEAYLNLQRGAAQQWGISQKQTGADHLSVGGALSANVHGRGLRLKPFVQDIESLKLVDASGAVLPCSRTENPELFRLAVGGYGLFGVASSVMLKLTRRQKLERVVELVRADNMMARFEQRIRDGYLYGDCQLAIDPETDDYLNKAIFSSYRPVDPETPIPGHQKELPEEQWRRLLYWAHAEKTRAFETYARHYLDTSGQVYWSDTHQLSYYPEGYHQEVDGKRHAVTPGSEMISELYVPRPALAEFLADVREDFRQNQVEVIYGTIRLIERDQDTFLPWAREPWACTVLNLHVPHNPKGIEHASAAFRRLIDMARGRGGTYFLTYHKWAMREQVEACYPEFPEFLRLKRRFDPDERFQSDWYRHYKGMFSDVL